MNYSITQIEDAIIAALKAAMPYAKTLKTYGGEFDEANKALIVLFPSVFVEYEGTSWESEASYDNHDVTVWETKTWNIYCGSKNLRSEEEARRKADIGAYAMLGDVKNTLAGTNLDLVSMQDFTPVSEQLMVNFESLVVYVSRYTVRWLYDINA